MKIGDTVWFWSALAYRDVGRIVSGTVVAVNPMATVEVMIEGKGRPCLLFDAEVFPTREALCEHYRKVFE